MGLGFMLFYLLENIDVANVKTKAVAMICSIETHHHLFLLVVWFL